MLQCLRPKEVNHKMSHYNNSNSGHKSVVVIILYPKQFIGKNELVWKYDQTIYAELSCTRSR